jgi:hypothetical protein
MTTKTLAKGVIVLTLSALVGGVACERYLRHREPHAEEARKRYAPVRGLGPEKLDLAPRTGRSYRLLLDAPTLERLRSSARLETPAFRYALARADEAREKDLESGYQGFEWADAVASASLAWHATGDERHATTALRYLRALLDDRFAVGDGKGGPNVVRHDSGYGIRTFGAYAALGYDWLRAAPVNVERCLTGARGARHDAAQHTDRTSRSTSAILAARPGSACLRWPRHPRSLPMARPASRVKSGSPPACRWMSTAWCSPRAH